MCLLTDQSEQMNVTHKEVFLSNSSGSFTLSDFDNSADIHCTAIGGKNELFINDSLHSVIQQDATMEETFNF